MFMLKRCSCTAEAPLVFRYFVFLLLVESTFGCLTLEEYSTNCSTPFTVMYQNNSVWPDICSSSGREIFTCVKDQQNCNGVVATDKQMFDNEFKICDYNIEYCCEIHLNFNCTTVANCTTTLASFVSSPQEAYFDFYNFFCGSIKSVLNCLQGSLVDCPLSVQKVFNFLFVIDNTTTVADVMQSFSSMCDTVSSMDKECLTNKAIELAENCNASMIINVPNKTFNCRYLENTTQECISTTCGLKVSKYFSDMFSRLCSLDLDECLTYQNSCALFENCTNTLGSYRCVCMSGFNRDVNENCTDIDECAAPSGSCGVNSYCNNTMGSYNCTCSPGFSGSAKKGCSDIDECAAPFGSCGAYSYCNNTMGSYNCTCSPGFSGSAKEGCSDIDECAAPSGSCGAYSYCTNTMGSYNCMCSPGFSGSAKEGCLDIDECAAPLGSCGANSYCTNTMGSYNCACLPGFSGSAKEGCSVIQCDAVTENGIEWQNTSAGKTVNKTCSSDLMKGGFSRICGMTGVWGKVMGDCQFIFNDILNELNQLENATENVHQVLESASRNLSIITNSTTFNQSQTNLENTVNIMKAIVDIAQDKTAATVPGANLLFNTINNLIKPVSETNWKALNMEQKEVQASNLLDIVDKYTNLLQDIVCNTSNETYRIVNENMYTELGNMPELNTLIFPKQNSHLNSSNIQIFQATFASKGITSVCFGGSFYTSVGNILEQQVAVSGIATTFLNSQEVNSVVMALQLKNTASDMYNNFDPPIQISFDIKKAQYENPMCVFWDFSIKRASGKYGAWSTEGCSLINYTSVTVVCECNHLSNFAILMSRIEIPPEHAKILSIISKIGCAISIACLILTLVAHYYVWRYVRSQRTTILLNLCVALLFALAIFLAGVERVESKAACTAIAALIQLLFLVVFFSMLIIGIEITICVVPVFVTKFRVKVLLPVAWLIPMIIVGASLAITKTKGYGNDKFCWLDVDSGLIWAFIGPVLFIICVNIIIIIVVLKKMAMLAMMKSKSKLDKIKTGLRSLCVLLPILGTTWVTGVLSVNRDMWYLQYIFCISNSLQGFFIFLLHCVLNKQLRDGFTKRQARKQSLATFHSDMSKKDLSSKEHNNKSSKRNSNSSSAELKTRSSKTRTEDLDHPKKPNHIFKRKNARSMDLLRTV